MSHGGPDAANIYINEQGNLGLGHRRLSILDLSDAGNQPMRYKHWILIFNGEIYNFKEIRKELEDIGYSFETGTDTEMLLKAHEHWGRDCIKKFRGMFAFAIWDEQQRELILCRDRVGVKPLYYYSKDNLFLFTSELKAFHEHDRFDKTINQAAVSLYLQQGYIQSPHSIFKYVKKVMPGSYLILNGDNTITEEKYWSVEEKYETSGVNTKSEAEVIEELEPILKESFLYRMVADVPVGMFLSGGIDSSLVTSMIQKHSNAQVKTFTIGFSNPKYNEAKHAKSVAQHIGTDHSEYCCSEDDFTRLIPRLPDYYDEPLGAGSSIPTYLVSTLAKEKVKVSLSADGGDEIFGGYTKYQIAKSMYAKISELPYIAKLLGKTAMRPFSPEFVERNLSSMPGLRNYTNLGTKFFKFKNAFGATSLDDFFHASSSYITKSYLEKLHTHDAERFRTDAKLVGEKTIGYLGMIDVQTFMEGEVLPKVDRATMRVALEGREPFLDQNIIEYGLGLPDSLKIRGDITKYVLRKILYKYVPKELIERPKQGFDIPMRNWTKLVS